MGLFSKVETIEAELPFKLVPPTADDVEACLVDVEAYGYIGDSKHQYYYACISINNDVYDEFVAALTNFHDTIKVIAKVKNGVVQKFKIDFKEIAEKLGDERFKKAYVAGYGIGEESYFDEVHEDFVNERV